MSLRKVPELSLLSYVNGSTQEKDKFVDQLFVGLKDYGFIILKDHTIDQKKIDRAYELVKKFFELPIETKMKYVGNNGGQRGYTPYKTEHAKDNKNPDLKEFWHVGRELLATSEYKGVYPENLWPSEISELRQTFVELYEAMDMTSVILLEAIGKALDLPNDYFTKMIHDGNSIIRMIHYPPTKGEDTHNSVRAADSGLQLLERDGTWLDVNSKPGEIVVDTGDMISRITNNVLPATTHRVINPCDDGSARFSMPFFVHPHSNALLKCIPSCANANGKTPETDITAGDFLTQRLREIGLLKS